MRNSDDTGQELVSKAIKRPVKLPASAARGSDPRSPVAAHRIGLCNPKLETAVLIAQPHLTSPKASPLPRRRNNLSTIQRWISHPIKTRIQSKKELYLHLQHDAPDPDPQLPNLRLRIELITIRSRLSHIRVSLAIMDLLRSEVEEEMLKVEG